MFMWTRPRRSSVSHQQGNIIPWTVRDASERAVPILSPGHFGTPDKPLLYQNLSHSLFRITFFLRICFELFVWRLKAISSPAAHLGNPDKFDCPQFGRRVESETLQFRPLLPRKITVLSDWRSGMKLKIFSPQRTFQTIQNSFLIQHRKEMVAESLLLATISYSEIRNYLVIFMLPT